ncbi:MAG: hypothetical protein ABIT68_02370 [Sphingomicrobium sp.]
MTQPANLRPAPSDETEALLALKPGDPFSMLDNSLGWAWGYAGKQRRVGYVRAESVGAP